MFRNSKLKKVLVSTLVFVLLLSTVVVAANSIYEKQLTATHGRIKFKVDGKDVTEQIESKYGSPAFVVHEYGNRAYVPLRAIAELMGLEVKYDDATHTAEIIATNSEEHETEIRLKNAEIAKLEKEVTRLENAIKDLSKDVVEETDLKALEKDLNKKFGTYDNIEFDISLKENKNNIAVSIDVDFYNTRQQSYWNRMTHADKKSMIEDITDAIAKEFKNADITGSVYDSYYRGDLLTFSRKKNSSSVSISYKNYGYDDYGYGYILDDAEDYLYDYFSGIAKNVYVNISESNGEIYGSIDIEEYGHRDPSDSQIQKAFRDAEDDLIYRYGSGVYFDIKLYLKGSSSVYGTYYKGSFK